MILPKLGFSENPGFDKENFIIEILRMFFTKVDREVKYFHIEFSSRAHPGGMFSGTVHTSRKSMQYFYPADISMFINRPKYFFHYLQHHFTSDVFIIQPEVYMHNLVR